MAIAAEKPSTVGNRQLAVFDLDGTLVRGDSFLPFLLSYAWRRRRVMCMLVVPWYVLLYACRLLSARTAKEKLLLAFFRGEPTDVIASHAAWFCRSWVEKRLRPDVLDRLHTHQAAGDRVILLSASPDLYVPAIGSYLGIHETIATRVAVADGLCMGLIIGGNCKGIQKIEALKQYLDCDQAPGNSCAYGDSQSDLPLLRWVRNGYLVAGGRLSPVSSIGNLTTRLDRAAAACFVAFGLAFCVLWALSILAFPLFKQRLTGYLPVVFGAGVGLFFYFSRFRLIAVRWLAGIGTAKFLGGLIVLALGLRLASVAVFPGEPTNDHRFFHLYALNLLDGKGFGGVSFQGPAHLKLTGGPRAFYPPGMSLLLVAWYWLTAPTPLAGQLLNVLCGTALVLLVYDVGRRAAGESVGRWAALLTSVMPSLAFYAATLGYEVVLATIFCGITDLALLASRRPKLWHLAAIGALTGFGALIKPVCLLIPLLLLVWWLVSSAGWRSVAYACGVSIIMGAVILPWTWRNYRTFNDFVLISTNGGYVLYSANNPKSQGIAVATDAPSGETDEVSMDRLRSRAAIEWIFANPVQFLRLAVNKTVLTWGTSSTVMSFVSDDRLPLWQENLCMAMINVVWTAWLVFCVAATWTTAVWQEKRLYLAFMLLAYLVSLHLVFEAHSRHHLPVLWVQALVAAFGLVGGVAPRPRGEVVST